MKQGSADSLRVLARCGLRPDSRNQRDPVRGRKLGRPSALAKGMRVRGTKPWGMVVELATRCNWVRSPALTASGGEFAPR